VESVDLYEIKDSELELFRRGSPGDLQFNFAIFALSMAFSAILALYTATFRNDSVHTAVIVVAVVGTLFGVYLLIAWWRNRESLAQTCDVIRKRIKEPEIVIKETTVSHLVASIDPAPPTAPSEPKK
jgi:hypothetical protein